MLLQLTEIFLMAKVVAPHALMQHAYSDRLSAAAQTTVAKECACQTGPCLTKHRMFAVTVRMAMACRWGKVGQYSCGTRSTRVVCGGREPCQPHIAADNTVPPGARGRLPSGTPRRRCRRLSSLHVRSGRTTCSCHANTA